ncbi:MAG: hypothetical protein R3308_05005, partial [Thiohalobacterales bacterium]|nr:hypothetical protein [Thiohalobacterales bacterium]
PLLAWYLVSLLGGLLTGIIYVGDAGLRLAGKTEPVATGMRVLSILLAVVVMVLIQLVPAVGSLVMLLLFLLGLGAFQLQAWHRYAH